MSDITYTLRVPFQTPLEQQIEVGGEPVASKGLTFSLEKSHHLYVLKVEGFHHKEEASQFLNNVRAGLMWLLLHKQISSDAEWQIQKVKYAEDPYEAAKNLERSLRVPYNGPIDGAYDDNSGPVVYPSDKRLVCMTLLPPTLTITNKAKDVLRYVSEGASFPESAQVAEDTKLRTAFELYGAYFTEQSANARFLMLVMALEALTPNTLRVQFVLDLLKKWESEVDELCMTSKINPDDASSLHGQLSYIREESIRQQIRTLVKATLQSQGDKDAEEMSTKAVEAYGDRSTLVHDGRLDPQKLKRATADTKMILERILKARFSEKAQVGTGNSSQ